ncbi:MAG: hypothetical protein ACYSTF_02020 [Planctomycetota bacterium]
MTMTTEKCHLCVLSYTKGLRLLSVGEENSPASLMNGLDYEGKPVTVTWW